MINLLKDVAEAQASGASGWIKVAIELIATAGIVFGGTGYWQYRQARLQSKKDEAAKKENIELLNNQFKSLNSKFDGMSNDLNKIKADIELLQAANKATVAYREARDEQDKTHSAERKALIEALTDTMRSRLLDFFERCRDKGYYTVEERNVYHSLYERYKSAPFNGNGVMDDLHNKLINLPTTEAEAHPQILDADKNKTTKNVRHRKTTRA